MISRIEKMTGGVKTLLGEMPYTAELYWRLRQRGRPTGGFTFQELRQALPVWREQALAARGKASPASGKKVLIFGTLRYWIEHAVLTGMALGGLGHAVSLAYLPYANWHKDTPRFDLRRQNEYLRDLLQQAAPVMQSRSWFGAAPALNDLPAEMRPHIREAALQDTQYTLQVEEVDLSDHLYAMRLARNVQAANAALQDMSRDKPDVVLLPSGSILEFAAVYHTARHLEIPVVTYEFGEQKQRIWFSLNSQVMRQDTDAMWAAYRERPLTDEQLTQIRELYAARQNARLWQNFARSWQGVPSAGGQKVRADLGLDGRPVVLLAANVIGDSLTLGRQVFTDTMTEWLVRTTRAFAARPQVQLVIRIHPGERYTQGPSVAEVVKNALAPIGGIPENIHLVAADAAVNTYDLVESADLGLVYTTTVGMEMALSGVAAVVIGQTHYRGRGFTYDPSSWDEYDALLAKAFSAPGGLRLTEEQVKQAWNYAYHFFFDFPCPFPWHLWHFWKDVADWPLERVLAPQGQERFGQTFRYLTGEARSWGGDAA